MGNKVPDGILINTGIIKCPDNKRSCFNSIISYLENENVRKVCALMGLKGTGKTVLLKQAYNYSVNVLRESSVFITIRMDSGVKTGDLCRVLDNYIEKGVRNFFIDEVTFVSDFQYSSNVLADHYVSVMGVHLILAGAYSLSFIGAGKDTLYDRIEYIPTSYISYSEYKRLFPERDTDTYLKSACTLSDSFSDFNDTHDYIENYITDNIEFSLKNALSQRWYCELRKLYENGDLRSAVAKCIERFSFDLSETVLNGAFKNGGLLDSAAELYRKSDHPEVSKEVLADTLYEYQYRLFLREELLEEASHEDMRIIRYFLKESGVLGNATDESDSLVIIQYGLVYSCALHLLDSIIAESAESGISFDLSILTEIIHEEILENLLKTMLLFETTLDARRNGYRVEKYSAGCCEFDMAVIFQSKCDLYEIKHSSEVSAKLCRLFRDRDPVQSFLENHKGVSIRSKNVIYYGKTKDINTAGDIIHYINVEDYLRHLE